MGKQLVAAIALLIVCGQAFAQLEKDKFYPGLSYQNRFKFDYTTYGTGAQLSYALDKHNLVGVNYNYYRSNKFPLYFQQNSRGYFFASGTGLTYTYFRYFKNSKKLGWSITSDLNFNTIRYYTLKTSGQYQLDNRYHEAELSVKPGLFYTPSRNVIIFANFGGYSLNKGRGYLWGDFNFGSQVNVGALINLDFFQRRK